jgi:hypothetical protein
MANFRWRARHPVQTASITAGVRRIRAMSKAAATSLIIGGSSSRAMRANGSVLPIEILFAV